MRPVIRRRSRGLPGVFEVVRDKRELPDVLARQGIVDMPRGISHFDGRKRAYVKVQDGCILKCTYCIIPQVRPGLASRSPDDIEDEVRRLVGNGYREIVLTGIHVGHYGVDSTRGRSGRAPFRLWHLFRRLDRIAGEWRMRLSSIEAAEMNDDFISAAADCEHLCPQFHPALQSGSEAVLRRMRRRYSVAPIPGEDRAMTRAARSSGLHHGHDCRFSGRDGGRLRAFGRDLPPRRLRQGPRLSV